MQGLEAPPNIIMSEMGSQAPAYKAYMVWIAIFEVPPYNIYIVLFMLYQLFIYFDPGDWLFKSYGDNQLWRDALCRKPGFHSGIKTTLD